MLIKQLWTRRKPAKSENLNIALGAFAMYQEITATSTRGAIMRAPMPLALISSPRSPRFTESHRQRNPSSCTTLPHLDQIPNALESVPSASRDTATLTQNEQEALRSVQLSAILQSVAQGAD